MSKEEQQQDQGNQETEKMTSEQLEAWRRDRGDFFAPADDHVDSDDDNDDLGEEDLDLHEDEDEIADAQGKATADDAGSKDPEKTEKPITIPKGRFDELNQKKQELEAEIAELRKQLGSKEKESGTGEQPPAAAEEPKFDFAAKRRELREAEDDFDDEKAAAIQKEIEEAEEARINWRVQQAVEKREREAVAIRERGIVSELEKQLLETHPALNEDSTEFFAFVGFRDKFLKEGKSLFDAMADAAKAVFGDKDTGEDESANEEEEKDVSKLSQRELAARLKNAKAATQQPPRVTGGMGTKEFHKTIDVEKLSEEEFDKLSPEERKRLRGDFVGKGK